MKPLQLTTRIILLLSVVSLITCAQTPVQKESRSIAVLLKINGNGDDITNVSVRNYNIYEGRVKPEIEAAAENNFLHVKISNEKDSVLFDRYFENPLTKNAESFGDNGKIEKVVSPRTEDYLNIRFSFKQNDENLKIVTSQKKDGEEKPVSTFNLKLK